LIFLQCVGKHGLEAGLVVFQVRRIQRQAGQVREPLKDVDVVLAGRSFGDFAVRVRVGELPHARGSGRVGSDKACEPLASASACNDDVFVEGIFEESVGCFRAESKGDAVVMVREKSRSCER